MICEDAKKMAETSQINENEKRGEKRCASFSITSYMLDEQKSIAKRRKCGETNQLNIREERKFAQKILRHRVIVLKCMKMTDEQNKENEKM